MLTTVRPFYFQKRKGGKQMITIQKSDRNNKDIVCKYERHILQSVVNSLPLQKNHLLSLVERPQVVCYDNIKALLQDNINQYTLRFTLRKRHIPLISDMLSGLNIRLVTKQTKRKRINLSILNQDHNHFTGRNKQL